MTAVDGITLRGDIETSNEENDTDVTFTGAVKINGSVTIDTDAAAKDGAIEFTSTIDSLTAGSGNLTILAGDTGAAAGGGLTFGGTIGGTNALGTLNINATAGTVAFSVPQIGDGTGTKGAAATAIANANSGLITLDATGVNVEYNFTDNVIFKGGSGEFDSTDPTIDLDGEGKL